MKDSGFTEASPRRNPPPELGRRQVLVLDGLRYSVEMADVAYRRLDEGLAQIHFGAGEIGPRAIASLMLDAWSIVDSVHRFVDFAGEMKGLKQGVWFELLRRRTTDALDLRNDVQHLVGHIRDLASNGGQLWGYLSWAEWDGTQ